MASPHIPNYLRANRKRLGLSQEDVSFLLGTESGAKACRYEKFTRTPSLKTALAYEVVLGKPIRALFTGLFRKIEKEVITRARTLSNRTHRKQAGKPDAKKNRALEEIAKGRISNQNKKS